MSPSRVLTKAEAVRLPPMLFGRIRWLKSLGAPVGDPASGFKVQAEEHTPSQLVATANGEIDIIPGTWRPAVLASCKSAPDAEEWHVVFNVPDVHLTGWPDGAYRVEAQLTASDPAVGVACLDEGRDVAVISYGANDLHSAFADAPVANTPLRG
jgi:hypothetical protein